LSKILFVSSNSIEVTLVKTAMFSMFLQVGGMGVTFLMYILLARLLGITDYGNYVYVLTWTNILVLISKFGLDVLLLRYVAAYEGKQAWNYLRGILVWSLKTALFLSITINSMLLFSVWGLISYLRIELINLFFLSTGLILLFTLSDLILFILRGLQHTILSQTIGLILRPVLLGLSVLVLYAIKLPLSGFLVMLVHICTTLLIFILLIFLVVHYLPSAIWSISSLTNKAEWRTTAFLLLFLSGAQLIMNQTDTVMLGLMRSTEEAGIYASAARIAEGTAFGLSAFNAFAAPLIAKLYALEKKLELQRLLTMAAWGILVVTIIAGAFLISMGKLILSLFGQEFIAGYFSLVILLLGQVVNSLAGSVGLLMTMTGNQVIIAKVIIISTLLNIGLNFLLIPYFGMLGAAIATSITVIFVNLALLWFVQQKIGLNPTIFSSMRS
jgi:O-antigen/teichoic acid export membrane protein